MGATPHRRDPSPPVVPARIRGPTLNALRRERLLRLLGPLWRHRLTLVVAPAGSGKTTLLAQLAAAAAAPVAWYRAERGNGDPVILLAHMEASVRAALGAVEGPWRDAGDAARALERARPGRLLLVIDDLHVLHQTAAEGEIGRLLDYLPDTIAMLAAGRGQPAINLSRLRVEGTLLEVGSDALRFRSWEVERLYRDFYAEPLRPEELAELTRHTGGWAAGLQLFHLATRGKPVEQRRLVLGGLATRSRLVREYLTRNVLDDLDAASSSFLLGTSVLGRLGAELCDRLLGRRDSRALLDRLESQQLVTCLLDGEGWFRYHEVLRSHLEAIAIEEMGEARVCALRERAGALLEESGFFADALEAYCRAEDWAAAAHLLGIRGAQLVEHPGWWVELLPVAMLEEDPWMMLATARRRRVAGQCGAAVRAYRAAEEAFGGAIGAEVCRRERSSLAVWTDTSSYTQSAGWPGAVRKATIRDPLALRLPGGGHHAADRLVAGLGALLGGQIDTARDLLAPTAEASDTSRAVHVCSRVGHGIARVLGALDDSGDALAEATDEAEAAGFAWLTRLGRDALLLVDSETDRAEPAAGGDDAEDVWGEALRTLFDGWGRVRAGLDARRPLLAAAAAFGALGAPVLETWASALLALAQARQPPHDGRKMARRAESMARSLGVPGARALALLALSGHELREGTGRLALTIAAECGLALPPAVASTLAVTTSTGAESDPLDTMPAVGVRPAPSVAITCLGAFTMEVRGHPLDLRSGRPRVRSLLRLLALHGGRPVHREAIIEWLWPEVGCHAAMRNLHVAVSSLRQLLEPGMTRGASSLVGRDSDAYRLWLPEGSALDLLVFDEALLTARRAQRAGRAEEAATGLALALDVYRGDLLPEEGPAEWVVAERERYRAAAAEAAFTLASLLAAAGDNATAVTVCERGLLLDRHHDLAWRLLVDVHERAGDAAAAAHARRRYAAVLAELGVETPTFVVAAATS